MKVYANGIGTLYDGPYSFDYERQCSEIIKELYRICNELCLNFLDFKEAFVETRISYTDIKSFERVLTNGWPPAFFKNNKKRENFLHAVEKALENCANGKHILKRSDLETVKKAYDSFIDDSNKRLDASLNELKEIFKEIPECRVIEDPKERPSPFRARLSSRITFALRADPESFAEEEAEFQISRKHRAAKYFWDGIWATIKNEGDGYERIEGEDWLYYKVHAITCVQFCEMLKNDPIIMKRLQQIFDEVDKADPIKEVEERIRRAKAKAKREEERAQKGTTTSVKINRDE